VDLVKDLTKRQKQIFDYISSYLSKHGYPPTVREIGKAVGLHSSSTVHAHLSKLETLGVLKRDPSKPRALEVMVERAKKAVRPSGLPLVGQVAAGSPILAEENIE
jgi:repressor LexA